MLSLLRHSDRSTVKADAGTLPSPDTTLPGGVEFVRDAGALSSSLLQSHGCFVVEFRANADEEASFLDVAIGFVRGSLSGRSDKVLPSSLLLSHGCFPPLSAKVDDEAAAFDVA